MIGSCLIVELLGILVSKVLEKQPTIYTLSRYGFAFIFLFLVEVLSSAALYSLTPQQERLSFTVVSLELLVTPLAF